MNVLILVLLYLAALCSLGVGLLVLLRDYRRVENISFFGLGIGVSCWAIGIAGFIGTNNLTFALFWAKFYYVAPLVIVVSSIYFSQYFPFRKQISKIPSIIISILGIILTVLLIAIPTFVTESIVYQSYGKLVNLDSQQYAVYGSFLLFCFCLTILTLIQKRKTSKHVVEIQQVNIFLFGFVISSILGVYFNLVLPAFGNYQLIAAGPIMTAFWIIASAYAIAKHRMFDIRSFVIRAAGYLITSAFLSMLYIAPLLYLVANIFMEIPFDWSNFIFGILFATVVAYNFNHIRAWFDTKTAHIFFRDSYDPAIVLSDFTRLLVSTIDISKLLNETSTYIASRLKIESVSFVLNETATSELRVIANQSTFGLDNNLMQDIQSASKMDDEIIAVDFLTPDQSQLKGMLQNKKIAVIIPLSNKSDTKYLGYIVLDYKKSGNPYTAQDLRTLSSMAGILIIAIQNALHFEEIQDFNLTLQQKVYDATAQLRRTNAKLKALDETKDDFISMASHQLRTPLTSVKGYLSMVLEGDGGKITPMQRKMLDRAYISSQRMVFLISDLLNVSRLKTGKFVIEPSSVDLSKIIDEEVKQLKESARNRSIELVYDKPPEFPTLMIDDTKIRQVIMNFIDNALYYTPKGGKVTVRLSDNPSTIELRVIDNGIGVPKAEQPHLFTKFYRAGNARQVRPDGTGLGLFMAKKVIVAQGGAVIFDSVEGKGSTFGFVFSKARLAAPERERKQVVAA